MVDKVDFSHLKRIKGYSFGCTISKIDFFFLNLVHNYVYTQVVDNRRIITSFFLEHNEPLLTGLLIG